MKEANWAFHDRFKEIFRKLLDEKTGWGKEEIKKLLAQAEIQVMKELLTERD